MNNLIRKSLRTLLLTGTLTAANIGFSQTSETTTSTTTSAGTLSEFGTDTMMIRTETSPDPVSYSYSKTTSYVDEAGNPVSIETVKTGLPVTVYYTQVGDKMVATKVIVKKAVVVPAAATVEEKKTTTTTESTQ